MVPMALVPPIAGALGALSHTVPAAPGGPCPGTQSPGAPVLWCPWSLVALCPGDLYSGAPGPWWPCALVTCTLVHLASGAPNPGALGALAHTVPGAPGPW